MSVALRFVSGGAWDSRVIEWQTRCRWSHVEVISGPGVTLGAMLRGGVIYRHMDSSSYSHVKAVQIIDLPLSTGEQKAFWQFLQAQLGKPYDWRAILSFGLGNRDWRSPDSWFCSELQARALEMAGWLFLPKSLPVSRVTPRDLFMLVCSKLNLDLVRDDTQTQDARRTESDVRSGSGASAPGPGPNPAIELPKREGLV